MIKKIFLILILSTLIFSENNFVQAEEIFVGKFKDGCEVFLLTETVDIVSKNPYKFSCEVRADDLFIKYFFFTMNGKIYCTNTNGYSDYLDGGVSPIAPKIYKYVANNF